MIGKVMVTVRPPETVCTNGWDGTLRKPACNYTGGHFCDRLKGHKGRCRCSCGSTCTLRQGRIT